METVTVSPKFQVVIPKKVRQMFNIQPGQKIQVLALEDRIEFIPVRSMKSARGFLKGMTLNIDREQDRL
jgi:AbrB family looped-hinge helix DNA binding protein